MTFPIKLKILDLTLDVSDGDVFNGSPKGLSTGELSDNLLKLHNANNRCKHPAQLNQDPYSHPGPGQEEPSPLHHFTNLTRSSCPHPPREITGYPRTPTSKQPKQPLSKARM